MRDDIKVEIGSTDRSAGGTHSIWEMSADANANGNPSGRDGSHRATLVVKAKHNILDTGNLLAPITSPARIHRRDRTTENVDFNGKTELMLARMCYRR